MHSHSFKGQTLLITVLVLTIALTVALSLIRRTTMDVTSTGQLEESARAFSAAEAGIEHILKMGPAGATGVTVQSANGSATFSTTYTNIAGSPAGYSYATSTEKGDIATIWLVPHTVNNTLDESGTDHYCLAPGVCQIEVCWNQPTTPTDIPAIEVGILYKTNAGVYDIQRFAYDPDAARIGNNFTRSNVLGTGCGGLTNVYSQTVTLPSGAGLPLALRLRPYYNKTSFTVSPVGARTTPSQGFEVSSTGKTETGVTRKIVVKKKYDATASLFDFVLYADTKISNEMYEP